MDTTIPTRKINEPGALRLLCFDGGGSRGLIALFLLKDILHHIENQPVFKNNGVAKILPCEYFDMICGTSTGGLIAIMLGKLRMSVDEAIDAYIRLSESVFAKPKSFWKDELFSGKELAASINTIVGERAPDLGWTNGRDVSPEVLGKRIMVRGSKPDDKACKVFLYAVDALGRDTEFDTKEPNSEEPDTDSGETEGKEIRDKNEGTEEKEIDGGGESRGEEAPEGGDNIEGGGGGEGSKGKRATRKGLEAGGEKPKGKETTIRGPKKGDTNIRTYRSKKGDPEDFAIWEAARATVAYQDLFKPMVTLPENGRMYRGKYVNRDLSHVNPIRQLLWEGAQVFPDRSVGFILSIGTGSGSGVAKPRGGFLQQFQYRDVSRVTEKIANACDKIDKEVSKGFVGHNGIYFRFNIKEEVRGLDLGEWSGRVAMPEHVQSHLNGDGPKGNLKEAAKSFIGLQTQITTKELAAIASTY